MACVAAEVEVEDAAVAERRRQPFRQRLHLRVGRPAAHRGQPRAARPGALLAAGAAAAHRPGPVGVPVEEPVAVGRPAAGTPGAAAGCPPPRRAGTAPAPPAPSAPPPCCAAPCPAGSSQGRLHFATTGSPSRQAARGRLRRAVRDRASPGAGCPRPRTRRPVPPCRRRVRRDRRAAAAADSEGARCVTASGPPRRRSRHPSGSVRRDGTPGPPLGATSATISAGEAPGAGGRMHPVTKRDLRTGLPVESATTCTSIPARPSERTAPSVPW